MARTARPTTDHLAYLRRAAASLARIGPLALLRGAEARAPALPRIGASKNPARDVVTLVHAPALAFPAATLAAITVGETEATVEGHWLGLTGAMGPLPLHLTEYAAYERRYVRQQPFGRFLDLVSGRILQLFYRAWAVTVPAASLDRPDDDHFGQRIAALSGAEDGARAESAFPPHARLRYAALFASPRSPSGIADALGDLMRLPVSVVEYIERWRDVAPDDRTSLGGAFASLGRDTFAGRRIHTVDEAIRVVVHVASARTYQDLLPGGARYAVLVEAIDAFVPPPLEWDIELSLAGEAIRPVRLDASARLGWSSWIGPLGAGRPRADARLGANARQLSRRPIEEIPA